MRACNSSLHAGVIRSYVTLALAISNAALTKKFCSPHISESDNLRYSARVCENIPDEPEEAVTSDFEEEYEEEENMGFSMSM